MKKNIVKCDSKIRENAAMVKKQWVRLTRVCNNRCLFCLDEEAQDGSFLLLNSIKKELSQGRKNGATRAVLSGGEATLHPQFMEIIRFSKEAGYTHVQCITNGRMFAYCQFLKEAVLAGLDEITFSIHGHRQEIHDELTGVRGSFAESIQGVKNALRANLIVNIDIVINKINIQYLLDMIKFFARLGIKEFDLLQIMPFGRAWENKDKLFYDIASRKPFLDKVFNLSLTEGFQIWTNRFPAKYLEGYEHLIQHPIKLFDEVKGRSEIFNDYIIKGKPIECFGPRCEYCFLGSFCKDLMELKTKGKLLEKDGPLCAKGQEKRASRKHQAFRFRKKSFNLFTFLDFYIANRYFVKSASCRLCQEMKNCSGANIERIRAEGFKMLRPCIDSSEIELHLPSKCQLQCIFCSLKIQRTRLTADQRERDCFREKLQEFSSAKI